MVTNVFVTIYTLFVISNQTNVIDNGKITTNYSMDIQSLCDSKYFDVSNYIYKLAIIYNDSETAKKYVSAIYKNSVKYNLNPIYVAKQQFRESRFNATEISSTGARGSAAVNPKHWYNLLQKVNDGKLWKEIKNKNNKNDYQYFHDINYNTEMQCIIMKFYINKYGSYRASLVAYAYGEYSDTFKKYIQKKNVEKILSDIEYARFILEKDYAQNYIYKNYKIKLSEPTWEK